MRERLSPQEAPEDNVSQPWWKRRLFQPKSLHGNEHDMIEFDGEQMDLVKAQLQYVRLLYEYLHEIDDRIIGIIPVGSTLKGYAHIDEPANESGTISDIDVTVLIDSPTNVPTMQPMNAKKMIVDFMRARATDDKSFFRVECIGYTNVDVISRFPENPADLIPQVMPPVAEDRYLALARNLLFPAAGEIQRVKNARSILQHNLAQQDPPVVCSWLHNLETYLLWCYPVDEPMFGMENKMMNRGMIKQSEKEVFTAARRKLIRRKIQTEYNPWPDIKYWENRRSVA